MNTKIKWGIMGCAHIALDQVIPAIVNSRHGTVSAIASRKYETAVRVAKQFNIPKAYGLYQQLLDDPEITALYIPLPNHLHVPWAIKALRAGKHVLVEKPVGLSSVDAQQLLDESQKHLQLKVMEAFMYRFHPQWIKVKELVDNRAIGELKTIQSSFSFYEDDPKNIVNIRGYGGGSLMDIGCYPISLSRFLFNSEPDSIRAKIEYHPKYNVDIMASVILGFDGNTSSFFSATQLAENQSVHIFGTEGSIRIDIPFNPPIDKPTRIWLNIGSSREKIEFDICNQYTLQADHFSLAILKDTPLATPLQDAVDNMRVIEKIVESDRSFS